MNFAQLKSELASRGFDYLSDSRIGFFINQGRHELDMMELWPYRITEVSGTPPLTISDLGTIEEVVDTSNNYAQLQNTDRRTLRSAYNDISTTGSPTYFFVDNTSLRVFPIGGSVTVRYYKRPADLSGSTDTPLAPSQYHMLIIDMAARWAYKDSDNEQEAQALGEDINRQLQIMRLDLLLNTPGNRTITDLNMDL